MFFKKKEREKRIRWKIGIEGLTADRKPNYAVYKARAPYGMDFVCFFNELEEAKRFIKFHMEFPLYFYEGDNL